VVGLDPNNSASCGGPEVGELILKFDGREINDSADLIKIADAAKIGKELPVVVLRDGAQKTKVLKLAPPPPTLRRPSCEELLSLPRVQVPTGAVEQLFGKRFDYMRLTEFDQAISIVNDCIDLHRRTNRLVATPAQLIIAHSSLQARQRGRVARERLVREGNDAEVRRRLETELTLTQARIAAEQAEARRRFEAEQRSAELVAKADDCRRHCPQKLSNMLRELRSLGTAEGGVNRFRELGLEYQTMVREMPNDVKQGLAAEMERFATLLQEYEPYHA
jgi:hypothetical protein